MTLSADAVAALKLERARVLQLVIDSGVPGIANAEVAWVARMTLMKVSHHLRWLEQDRRVARGARRWTMLERQPRWVSTDLVNEHDELTRIAALQRPFKAKKRPTKPRPRRAPAPQIDDESVEVVVQRRVDALTTTPPATTAAPSVFHLGARMLLPQLVLQAIA